MEAWEEPLAWAQHGQAAGGWAGGRGRRPAAQASAVDKGGGGEQVPVAGDAGSSCSQPGARAANPAGGSRRLLLGKQQLRGPIVSAPARPAGRTAKASATRHPPPAPQLWDRQGHQGGAALEVGQGLRQVLCGEDAR